MEAIEDATDDMFCDEDDSADIEDDGADIEDDGSDLEVIDEDNVSSESGGEDGKPVHLSSGGNGYGFRVAVFRVAGAATITMRVTDFQVAKRMSERLREVAGAGLSPAPAALDALRQELAALKAAAPPPIYSFGSDGPRVFVFVGGCSPVVKSGEITERIFEMLGQKVVDSGHHWVHVATRVCGGACQQARKSGKVQMGLCAQYSLDDKKVADGIVRGHLNGSVHRPFFRGASSGIDLGGEVVAWNHQGAQLVSIFFGASASSCLSWAFLADMQAKRSHAYVPHPSRTNAKDVCEQIAAAFTAFGVEVDTSVLHAEGLKITADRLHTDEVNESRSATLRRPDVRARISAGQIQTGLKNAMDADLLERIDFSKSKFYAVKCKACLVVLADRCTWSTHCKAAEHQERAPFYRQTIMGNPNYRVVREVRVGDGERYGYECLVCKRKNNKKKIVINTFLRPRDFRKHDALDRHKTNVQKYALKP